MDTATTLFLYTSNSNIFEIKLSHWKMYALRRALPKDKEANCRLERKILANDLFHTILTQNTLKLIKLRKKLNSKY